ncbi:MAG TPA: OmpW family outer membrane protein [Caldimonas sp.]|nr:OmpW family outer membrane protein [Caldimonas sp.]HEX4233804.1 OmpW family outer membrane protein [Caldimonas sp.]
MKTLPTLALVALALASGAAVADGDNVVKVGITRYDSHAKTDGITGIGVPPGADVDVDAATTAIFVYERLLTPISPNLGLEFVLGVPPTLKAHGTGSVAFLGEVLSAKNLAPTLLLNYHFFGPDTTLRPYLGIGVNYTHFSDIKSSLATDVQMGNSTGLALQAGVNYAINKQVGLFASVAKVNVKSKVVASGATVLTTTVDFRPIVYSAGVSYQF